MAKAKTVEMDRTDLSTLLGCLASDLRNAGMAIRGGCQPHPDEGERRDADRLAGSLERVAATLDVVRGHFCQTCQLLDVAEQVRVVRQHPEGGV